MICLLTAFLAYEDASTKQVTLQSAYFSLIAATFVLSLFFFIKWMPQLLGPVPVKFNIEIAH